jgi:hypothetical protein
VLPSTELVVTGRPSASYVQVERLISAPAEFWTCFHSVSRTAGSYWAVVVATTCVLARSAVRVTFARSPARVVREVDPLGGHGAGGPLLLLGDLRQFAQVETRPVSRAIA